MDIDIEVSGTVGPDGNGRRYDFIDGSTAVEVKSGAGTFSSDQLSQLNDYIDVVDEKTATRFVTTNGVRELDRLRYVMTDPAGVRANLKTLKRTFARLDGRFEVTVFDSAGNPHVLDMRLPKR